MESKTDKLRTLIPLEELEQEAQQQIWAALAHPFLKTLAIMPDCHTGYSLPIGGVALLEGVVSPDYVGYDQGCGMCCVVTDEPAEEAVKDRKAAFDAILKRIPVGFNSRQRPLDHEPFASSWGEAALDARVAEKLRAQLGTLGGGNHFIEVGANRNGNAAVVIHSGSRKSGWLVGQFYMRLSRKVDPELPPGFLDMDGSAAECYLRDLGFFLKYALENRKRMMEEVLDVLGLDRAYMSRMINENHNHAVEMPGGLVLHRKGATPADKGQFGVIPGNMRDGTFVTVGLGNEEFLSSASHGAGRTMSRTAAKAKIPLDYFQEVMRESGVVCRADEGTLDEAPDAYKDINAVIARQDGIVVDVFDRITPMVNVKG